MDDIAEELSILQDITPETDQNYNKPARRNNDNAQIDEGELFDSSDDVSYDTSSDKSSESKGDDSSYDPHNDPDGESYYSASENENEILNESRESIDTPRSNRKGSRLRYQITSELDGDHWKHNVMAAISSSQNYEVNPSEIMENYFQLEASKSTPQYGFRKGLELFQDEGYAAAVKELKDNLIGRGCLNMVKPSQVTNSMRTRALNYLMFLKRKWSGLVKGRGCADGRPQRKYITKDESSLPTVSIYALMGSCVLDAIDERNVITVDIPGAFLQGDWPQEQHPGYIKFTGIMVDMICQIDPQYKNYIVWSKDGKRKYMYGELRKAVYGTLLAAIIFYDKLSKHLNKHGFEVNPYDECTFNKIVNGEQLTVQFHVDDLKASHKDQGVIDDFLDDLKAEFGKEDELSVTKGLKHNYLGMNIDYSLQGKVVFTMYDFFEDVIVEAPEELKSSRSCYPGDGKLFQVDEGSLLLNNNKADIFHQTIAQQLFASKRARPDIQVCVAFLCTRVKSPTEEDYRKLAKVITYLSETIHLPLVIGSDGSGNMTWNVDASYAVHPDCRSHTGASLTLGNGSVLSLSSKQKVNTKSSTEAERLIKKILYSK